MTYLVLFGIDTRPVKKFKESDDKRQNQSSNKNVENTRYVAQ